MNLSVRVCEDVSLQDLTRELETGGSVVKTPHVGSIYHNNLLMLSLGIPLICYDRTTGAKDTLFHPHGIVCDKAFRVLTRADILTTHARVVNTPDDERFGQYFRSGASVLEGHMRSLRDVFPRASITAWGDVIEAESDYFLAVLDQLARVYGQDFLGHWYRRVTIEGELVRDTPRSWDAMRNHVFRLTDQKQGWILPNLLNVFLTALLQHRQAPGKNDVYHLSGPDMIRYIGNMQGTLEGYSMALGSLGCRHDVVFNVVPVAHVRFAALDPGAFKAVWEGLTRMDAYLGESGDIFRNARGTLDKAVAQSITERRKELGKEFSDALAACPEIIGCPTERSTLTHYDLLGGGKLHTNVAVTQASVKELGRLWSLATRVHRQAA